MNDFNVLDDIISALLPISLLSSPRRISASPAAMIRKAPYGNPNRSLLRFFPMALDYTHVIERLVEDYGWEAVINELKSETAKRPVEDIDALIGLIDAAIIVIEDHCQSLTH